MIGSNFDLYALRAQIAPASVVAIPVIALALGFIAIDGLTRIWPLLSVAIIPLTTALIRRSGHRVEPKLFSAWGGHTNNSAVALAFVL